MLNLSYVIVYVEFKGFRWFLLIGIDNMQFGTIWRYRVSWVCSHFQNSNSHASLIVCTNEAALPAQNPQQTFCWCITAWLTSWGLALLHIYTATVCVNIAIHSKMWLVTKDFWPKLGSSSKRSKVHSVDKRRCLGSLSFSTWVSIGSRSYVVPSSSAKLAKASLWTVELGIHCLGFSSSLPRNATIFTGCLEFGHQTFALTNTNFDNKVVSSGCAVQSCNLTWEFSFSD